MAAPHIIYAWEDLPEYRCTQQLGRCIGRILVSLPVHYRRRVGRSLIRGSVMIAQGIAGANAEMPPEVELTPQEREAFRSGCIGAISICRDALCILRTEGLGRLPDILVALELLDRIESSVRTRTLPGPAQA